MSSDQQVHDHRVAGGYKATLSNPSTSEEAKEHARQMLDEMDADYEGKTTTTKNTTTRSKATHEDETTSNRVIGGYKATLTNPKTSAEAKQHAEAVLDGAEEPTSTGGTEEEKHQHRVIGGYKATIHNPNTSEEAKEHAREMLAEHGVEME